MARLLVIDDEVDACKLMQRMFSEQGHDVTYFTDEDEGLAWLHSEPVDLAIVDIQLKRKSGIDVLKYIRNFNLVTKIIIITAFPSVETAKQAVSLGADDYLIKPIEIDELEKKVNSLLSA